METTAKKKTPFYQIIIDDILAQIAAGSFSYDQPICTENSLIEQYGFSRITVRRAMTELENRGILYRKRGVGSFVCHPEELAPALPETSSSPAGKLCRICLSISCIQKTGLTDAFQAASDYLLSKGCYSSIYIADEREDKTGRSPPRKTSVNECSRSRLLSAHQPCAFRAVEPIFIQWPLCCCNGCAEHQPLHSKCIKR